MRLRAFRGLRPRADLSSRVPCLPYDVWTPAEAREAAAREPHSFLHVIRPEVDLDPGVDPHDARVYEAAGRNFQAMQERGWLVRDPSPALYVYRLETDGHRQTGLLGEAALGDYLKGHIRRHEHTRPDKEDDRVRLNSAIGANPGPVFLTYRPQSDLDAAIGKITAVAPTVRFDAGDGVEHSLWVVDRPDDVTRLEQAFSRVDRGYVADGHHRAAAAARVAEERLARQGSPDAAFSVPCFLAAYFPSDQLRILDYNRVVRDLDGLDAGTFLSRLADAGFDLQGGYEARRPPRPGSYGMYLAGRGWHLLTARPEIVPDDDAVRRLDVALLAERVLEPILGISDPRTDPRIDFVGGARGMDELERRVDSGGDALAFALYPTRLEDVMAVADSGQVMPPKSTWFEPKLRSGLVVQLLDDPASP